MPRRASIAAHRFFTDNSPSRRDFEPGQARFILLFKGENIGRAFDHPFLEEKFNLLAAQSVNIKGVARDEMPEPFDPLRRADQPAGTAPGHFAFLPLQMAAAGRAAFGKDDRPAVGRGLRHRDHLGDHVAGALDDHLIADLDAEAGDLVGVMQGGVLHHDPPTVTGSSRATGVITPVRPT